MLWSGMVYSSTLPSQQNWPTSRRVTSNTITFFYTIDVKVIFVVISTLFFKFKKAADTKYARSFSVHIRPQPFTVKENEARCIAIPLHVTAVLHAVASYSHFILLLTCKHARQVKYITILTYLISLTMHNSIKHQHVCGRESSVRRVVCS